MAVSVRNEPGTPPKMAASPLVSLWQDRRDKAKRDRRRYEPTWHLCREFLGGRQWVGWSLVDNRIVPMPNPGNRERHTTNVLTQYYWASLGRLLVENIRPDLSFRREDIEARGVASEAQRAYKYAWDNEIQAEEAIFSAWRKFGVYGTSAIRCFFDPTRGPVIGEMPVVNGQVMTDPMQAREVVAQAQAQGQNLEFREIREGRIQWEALSPFSILPPPGIDDERRFPWLIVERALPLSRIRMRWPDAAANVREMDLSSIDSTRETAMPNTRDEPGGPAARLTEHALISTGYESPSDEFPEGREVVWCQNELLEERQKLTYRLADEPHNGITFFHYHRVDGRFWSTGIVEPGIGPQRQRNRARSQHIEMKDRNLGRIYAHKGTFTIQNEPKGKVMEIVEIAPGMEYPQETTGVAPGPWIQEEVAMNDIDIERAMGLHSASLGQAPAGVTAYASMALMVEKDAEKMAPIVRALREGIREQVMLTLHLIRTYWPTGKHLAISGDDNQIEVFMFDKAKLPDEFYVAVPQGAPLPHSPAAELQKIFDIYNAAIAGGRPLPVEWLITSIEQGRPQPVPKREEDIQRYSAELENWMIQQGQMPQVNYYDDDFIHIQVHRESQHRFGSLSQLKAIDLMQQLQSQMQSAEGGEQGAQPQQPQPTSDALFAQILEIHIQEHLKNAQLKAPTSSSVPQLQGGHGASGPATAALPPGMSAGPPMVGPEMAGGGA